ncbi:MAG: hypothetical protein IKM38_03250 [Christensenellaceae bacterium]|nr:hypothetical protein [Christensenellaceae bacterium]
MEKDGNSTNSKEQNRCLFCFFQDEKHRKAAADEQRRHCRREKKAAFWCNKNFYEKKQKQRQECNGKRLHDLLCGKILCNFFWYRLFGHEIHLSFSIIPKSRLSKLII